jgi:uncharacterized membrane protein
MFTLGGIIMRPKIKVPLKIIDIVLEVVCIALLLGVCLYIILSWPVIPSVVATHFNISGQADAYGNKSSVLFLLPFIIILYAGLTILQKFPHIYNYAVEITEKNAEVQYIYAVRMIRTIKFVMLACFSFIEFQTVRSALSGKNSLGIWFLPIFLICLFTTIGFYVRKSLKSK